MAKPPSSSDPTIDMRLSEPTKADLREFLKTMKDVKLTVERTQTAFKTVSQSIDQNATQFQTIRKEMQGIERAAAAMKKAAIMDKAGPGPGAYVQGQQFKVEQQVAATQKLGTVLAQNVELRRKEMSHIASGLRYTSQSTALNRANNLVLNQTTESFRQIVSAQKLKELSETASLRRGIEIQKGNETEARQAERISRLAEARITMLRREIQAEKEKAAAQKAYLEDAGRRGKQILAERKREAAEVAAAEKKAAAEQKAAIASVGTQTKMFFRSRIADEKAIKAVKDQAAAAEKAQLQALGRTAKMIARERTADIKARAAAEKKAYAESAAGMEEQARKSREATRQRLFGDGGANLFMTQANLMVNYAAMNQLRQAITGGIQFSGELDDSLRNLQAITVTTDTNLKDLKSEIFAVSEATKFFATDIAAAAVVLGQAGFSTVEIKDSISGIALLATATGTDLAKSVDIVTSILGVFKMESSQMAGVADTLTAAVNNSKLNIDRLTLGLQYAGNTAAQSGVSFEELTASMGAMANAGIRAGSTIGTGMRQILVAMQKPSGRFKDSLDRLGLTMDDVNLRTKGLYGAMHTLKEAGFTASDAIKSFETRAAGAFNALSNNLDDVVKLEKSFLNNAAAARANETQMRSVANQGKRLQANLQAVVAIGLEPLTYALRDAFKNFANILDFLRQYPAVLQGVTTAVASLLGGFVLLKGVKLVGFLISGAKAFKGLTTAMAAARAGQIALAGTTAALTGGLSLVALALVAGVAAYHSYNNEIARSQQAVERAQTAYDKAVGSLEAVGSQIEMVSGRIEELTNKSRILDDQQELLRLEVAKAKEQFRGMGFEVDDNTTKTEELTAALKLLRAELRDEFIFKMTGAGGTIETQKSLMEQLGKRSDQQRDKFSEMANLRRGRVSDQSETGRRFISSSDMMADPSSTPDMIANENAVFTAMFEANFDQLGVAEKQLFKNHIERMNQFEAVNLEMVRLQGEMEATQRETADALSLKAQAPLVERIEGFDAAKGSSLLDAAAEGGQDASPAERLALARQQQAFDRAELSGLRAEVTATEMTDGARAHLMTMLDSIEAISDDSMAGMVELAQSVAATAAEAEAIVQDARDTQLRIAQRKAGDAQDPVAIDTIGADLLANELARQTSEMDALKAANTHLDENAKSATGQALYDKYLAQLASLEAEHAERVKGIARATSDLQNKVALEQVAETEVMIDDLRKSLEVVHDPEVIQAVLDAMYELVDDKLEQQLEAASHLEEGSKARRDAVEAANKAYNEGIAEIDKLVLDEAVDHAARTLREAEILEKNIVALFDAGMSAKDAAEQRIKLIIAQAASAIAKANLVNATGERDNHNPEDMALELAEYDAAQAKTLKGVDTKIANNAKRKKSGGRKGRNPNSRPKDEVDLLIEDLKAKLTVAENYLQAGREISTDYDTVLDDALAKVNQLGGQIDTLQNKLQAGGLTVAEQKELNDLVEKQARMTSFIAKEEMRIAYLKMEQGKLTEGIILTVSSWAKENLNLAKTMQDGIVGGLSNAKSAMTEFFTSWTDGTKSGKEAFRDMTVSILKSIQNIFAEMLTVYMLQQMMGMFNINPASGFGKAASAVGLLKEGGPVKKAAMGEHVKGNLNRDSQRYDLMPGEYVLRRSAVQAIGVDELDRLNAMGNRVAPESPSAEPTPNKPSVEKDINIYLLDERSQASGLGPQDVIAVISDDMARGGTTKKLIKSIQMGQL